MKQIKLSEAAYNYLESQKIHSREPFNEVLERIIEWYGKNKPKKK